MMKRHCVTLFCVLFVLSLTFSSSDGRKCVPGKSYYDGCNYCNCGGGGFELCSYSACPGPNGGPFIREPAPADFWQSEVVAVPIPPPIPGKVEVRPTGPYIIPY